VATNDEIVQVLKDKFGDNIKEVVTDDFKHTYVTISRDILKDAAKTIAENMEKPLAEMVAVSDFAEKQEFELVYTFWDYVGKNLIHLKVYVPYSDPVVPSLALDFPALDWYEREGHEMFGVNFEGHPNLAPLLLEGFEGEYPMRKSFKLERNR